jgi:hypothetical protein
MLHDYVLFDHFILAQRQQENADVLELDCDG